MRHINIATFDIHAQKIFFWAMMYQLDGGKMSGRNGFKIIFAETLRYLSKSYSSIIIFVNKSVLKIIDSLSSQRPFSLG